jgi:hypothetical protein
LRPPSVVSPGASIPVPILGESGSTGPALVVRGSALGRLQLFWLAPLPGAGLAGMLYRMLRGTELDLRREDVKQF